jgi:WD40 repeat protein
MDPLPTDRVAPESSGGGTSHSFETPNIPDHTLLRVIGRGSYGEVWLGRSMMGIYRAIKVIYRKRFTDRGPFERELSGIRKFEPISRSHEGFVDILHVGINEERDYFYYIMELGDDQFSGQIIDPLTYSPKTLSSEVVRHKRLVPKECLEVGLKLSSALERLHEHSLVHRDVKPSNIIFVDGVPKLADIGLVAEIGGASSFVGTEGFVPPEGPGTPQADIYGLGKILYEASTGKDRQEFPSLPENFDSLPNKELFLEINAVIVRACVGKSEARYQAARDMHADLQLLAVGKSVKRLHLLERRFAQLRRIGTVGGTIGVILLGAIYHFYRESKMALAERQRHVGSDIAYGNAAMDAGDLLKALPYCVDALFLDRHNPKAEAMHRLRIGSVLAQCPKLTQLWIGSTNLQHCEFSPDGKHVIITQQFGPVQIYDAETSHTYLHPFGERCGYATYSPDGKLIVTAGSLLTLWRSSTLEEVHRFPDCGWVCTARFNRDGSLLVAACADGFVRVWDVLSYELKMKVMCSDKFVLFADFSHDGTMIVAGSFDHTATLRDSKDGHIIWKLSGHGKPVRYAAFSPDDTIVVTACEDHKARAFRTVDGSRILPDMNHPDGVASVQYSGDGKLLVTASIDGTARLWDADTLEPLNPNPILRHNERLGCASFAADGHRIVTCCVDGATRLWDLAGATVAGAPSHRTYSEDGSRYMVMTNDTIEIKDAISDKFVTSLAGVVAPITKMTLSHDGRFVATASERRVSSGGTSYLLQLWDATRGRSVGASVTLTNEFTGYCVSDDGKYIVTFGKNICQLWDVVGNQGVPVALVHTQVVCFALFSPSGKQLATASGSLVQLWNADGGWSKTAILQHATTVVHLKYSREGMRLVSSCSNNLFDKCYAQIWDALTGKQIGSPMWHRDGVGFACFSRDGSFIATASEDFTSSIWGLRSRQVLQHAHEVRCVSFSSDSKWVATASIDHTARVWDPETGMPLTPSLRHLQELSGVRFAPGGSKIITWGSTGDSWVWRLATDQRPPEDLKMLSDVLLSGTVTASNPMEFPKSARLLENFEKLRQKYPDAFVTSKEQASEWIAFHTRQSELSRIGFD